MLFNAVWTVLLHDCETVINPKLLQVEKVVCFDAFQSPIRNIQRMGRTGRHEAGHVIHILSEGNEERKYQNNLEASRFYPVEPGLRN